MTRLERLGEVQQVEDPLLRYWIVARWREALDAGAEVCFLLFAPQDPPWQTLWSACVGDASRFQPTLLGVEALIEYVVDHDAFYEVVVLANQDSGIVAVVPKTADLEASWSRYLQHAALPLPPRHDGRTARASEASGTPLFSLGRVVATPAALSALKTHGIESVSLLQRHAFGDWGEVCIEDAQANQTALRDGSRLLSSYAVGPGTKVWIITEADRSVTTLLLPEDY